MHKSGARPKFSNSRITECSVVWDEERVDFFGLSLNFNPFFLDSAVHVNFYLKAITKPNQSQHISKVEHILAWVQKSREIMPDTPTE